MELTSAHMVSNLIENVKVALKRYKVKSIIGSTDSTVVSSYALVEQTRTLQTICSR